jgi:hypothetical protein
MFACLGDAAVTFTCRPSSEDICYQTIVIKKNSERSFDRSAILSSQLRVNWLAFVFLSIL